MFVCSCHAVTEAEILDVIDTGVRTEDEIGEVTGAGTGCGSCVRRIEQLIDEAPPARCPRLYLVRSA